MSASIISDLWANPSNIPGGFSAVALELPVRVGDMEWTPEHAAPWSSSIGYSLALEFASDAGVEGEPPPAIAERWVPVSGHGEQIAQLYEVSDYGRVRAASRSVTYPHRSTGTPVTYRTKGGLLSPGRSGRDRNYLTVQLYDGSGAGVMVYVHELVLTAFVGPRPLGLVACHDDGDSTRNVPSNLRWDTVSANNYDRVRHGRHPKAQRTHCPRGHLLAPPNLELHGTYRRCLSCRRARALCNYRRQQGLPVPDLQRTADDHYRALAVEVSGSAPLVPDGRGWTTAHLWRRDTTPATTLCGRQVPDAELTAAPDLPVCGQCRRRASTPTTPENPS